ncbi:MAG: hypothetical protein ABIR03_05150 [Ginsengibacter sp.]
MKRLLAFILLLSHMNTSMFLPQVPEVDTYDANGNQLDDINSIVEYVMVKMGLDHHADDEDSDNGQNLHLVTGFQYTFEPFFTQIHKDYSENKSNFFPEYSQSKISFISYDIIVPPPKA